MSLERVPLHLWMYWHQGWSQAPKLVDHCRRSWEQNNPGWKLHLLDKDSVSDWCQLPEVVEQEGFPLASLSNVLRCQLLERYGGVWADATTWNRIPLRRWLGPVMESGFFAFDKPGQGRPISSWFLAAEPNHYLVRKWNTRVLELLGDGAFVRDTQPYWSDWSPSLGDRYFWFHGLFQALLDDDPRLRELWSRTPKVSATGPHALLFHGLGRRVDEEVVAFIREKRIPVYKLTHRMGDGMLEDENSVASYLVRSRWTGEEQVE